MINIPKVIQEAKKEEKTEMDENEGKNDGKKPKPKQLPKIKKHVFSPIITRPNDEANEEKPTNLGQQAKIEVQTEKPSEFSQSSNLTSGPIEECAKPLIPATEPIESEKIAEKDQQSLKLAKEKEEKIESLTNEKKESNEKEISDEKVEEKGVDQRVSIPEVNEEPLHQEMTEDIGQKNKRKKKKGKKSEVIEDPIQLQSQKNDIVIDSPRSESQRKNRSVAGSEKKGKRDTFALEEKEGSEQLNEIKEARVDGEGTDGEALQTNKVVEDNHLTSSSETRPIAENQIEFTENRILFETENDQANEASEPTTEQGVVSSKDNEGKDSEGLENNFRAPDENNEERLAQENSQNRSRGETKDEGSRSWVYLPETKVSEFASRPEMKHLEVQTDGNIFAEHEQRAVQAKLKYEKDKEQLMSDMNNLNEQLVDSKMKQGTLLEKHRALEAKYSELDKAAFEHKETLRMTVAELNQVKKTNSELTLKLGDLSKKQTASNEEVAVLKKQISETTKKAEGFNKEVQLSKEEAVLYMERIKSLQNRIESMERAGDDLTQEMKK